MCDAGFNSVGLGSSEVKEKLMSNLYYSVMTNVSCVSDNYEDPLESLIVVVDMLV
jgi:hypothetical protein